MRKNIYEETQSKHEMSSYFKVCEIKLCVIFLGPKLKIEN